MLVVATASAGTTIHTATAGTAGMDEIWMWAFNSSTSAVALTIQFGGTTAPLNSIVKTIPPVDGLYLVLPGICLQNGLIVRGFAGTASVVTVSGYYNAVVN